MAAVTTSTLSAGFTGLRLHTASGVLGQQPGLDPLLVESLQSAGTVEIVRPFHGVAVHGDMAGDLGAVYRGDAPRPDLTMVTVAAVLRAANKRVLVRDLNATTEQSSTPPGNAGLRVVKVQLPTWERDLRFAREMQAASPDTPVAVMGAVVAHLPDADGVRTVTGEPATACAAALGVEDVAIGAAYASFPLHCYRAFDGDIRVHLASSRGCDRTCRYCPYIRTFGRWAARSIGGFRADVASLLDLGVRRVQLRDQDFPSDPEHAEQVCRVIADVAGERIGWTVEGNLDRFTPRLLAAMRSAGVEEMIFGLESADETVLRSARRRVLRDTTDLLALANRWVPRLRGLFVIGLPEDSWRRVLATVEMAIRLDIAAAQFNPYAPLPGERFGNAETATVADYVPLTNDFRYRTCAAMSQKEVRLAARLAARAFAADRAGAASSRDEYLARIRQRADRESG
jgi:Radical SAM superfamily